MASHPSTFRETSDRGCDQPTLRGSVRSLWTGTVGPHAGRLHSSSAEMSELRCRMTAATTRDVRDDGLRLLAAIIECVPDIILVKDAETLRLVLTNRAGEEFFGVSRARLLGKSDHDLFPVDQADAFASTDRAVLAAGESVAIPG